MVEALIIASTLLSNTRALAEMFSSVAGLADIIPALAMSLEISVHAYARPAWGGGG